MVKPSSLLLIAVVVAATVPGPSRAAGALVFQGSTQATPAQQSPRLPIIFLPGVAGSQLFNNPPYVPLVSSQLWPVSVLGQRHLLGLTSEGKSAFNANIFVGDILRSGDGRFSSLADFYGSLIEFLEARGYKEGSDLFAFPYDWRLDNSAHYGALDAQIVIAKARSGHDKVILLGHSMGGLIMRGYALSEPKRAASLAALITMGTPYWGAPKVYYAMIKGYTFGNMAVAAEMMKILFQNWPAAYQLLPRENFIVDTRKTRELCPPNRLPITCPRQLLTPAESYVIRYKGMKYDRESYTETADNAWTLREDLVKLAADFHESAGTKQNPNLPKGVKLFVIIGHGIETLSGYALSDWEPGLLDRFIGSSYLELGAGRKVTMEPYFGDGDGTVPLWGLEISGATATYYVRTSTSRTLRDASDFFGGNNELYAGHGSLAKNKTVQAIVGQIVDSFAGVDNKPQPPDPGRSPKTSADLAREEDIGAFSLQ